MWTFYSDKHHLHQPTHELSDGELVPAFDKPSRADSVLSHLRDRKLGHVAEPLEHGIAPIARVHSERYLRYLEHAWSNWAAQGRTRDIIPFTFPVRGMHETEPAHPDGLAGYYAMDAGTPITAGTWQAVRSGVDCALTALARITEHGERAAFSLSRPPGHHAGVDYLGGYCYLNNAAIAAQQLIDSGRKRVAVLDVDYHHGNGTQQIFYERSDVLFVSIHSDPLQEYPFLIGHAAERGKGEGLGYNVNLPLPMGSDYARWGAALDTACKAVDAFAPETLIVSLGVDTYKGDPISKFALESSDYFRVGERIAACRVPSLFVMEGGYNVEHIGVNIVNVLEGFEGAR